LNADYQDAQRQLATLEELGKTRVATRQDVARARDRASDLERRIDLLKQRQALLASQIAGQGPLEESLLLRFASLEIVTKS
jgi:multidrug resistance efflux pump